MHLGIDEDSEPIKNLVLFNNWQNLQVLELNWLFADPNHVGDLRVLPLINPERPENLALSEAQRISIHTLKLHVRWSFCDGLHELVHLTPAAGWNDIDSVLAGPRFPNLRSIELVLGLEYLQTARPQANLTEIGAELVNKIHSDLPILLPTISAENVVKVNLSVVLKRMGH